MITDHPKEMAQCRERQKATLKSIVQGAEEMYTRPASEEDIRTLRAAVDRLELFQKEHQKHVDLTDNSLAGTARRMYGKK